MSNCLSNIVSVNKANKQVYVVGIADVESFHIKHICLSEETARKRFDKVREGLLKEAKRMKQRSKEYYKEHHTYMIELHKDTRFDRQLDSTYDHVVCFNRKLEP